MKLLLATALFTATAAHAWPVDVYVEARAGEEQFQKAAGAQWFELEKKGVADVEILPGDELLVTGKEPGETLLLLYGDGRMGVWKLFGCGDGKQVPSAKLVAQTWNCIPTRERGSVGTGGEAERKLATAACPGLRLNPASPADKLVVNIRTEECRKALLQLFKTDAYHSREITLTFDIPVMQSQLRELQAAVDAAIGPKKVELLYAGGSLRLKGSITQAEHRKVLWAVFNHAVGRVTLDDRLVLTDKPDAGKP